MPYLNLKAEMAKKNITREAISELLGIHRNSVSNKINGESSFTIDEAVKIRNAFFPDLKLDYLFERGNYAEDSISIA